MKLYPQGKNKNLVVFEDGKEVFFSYQTPVAARIDGKLYATRKHHSQTTTRHLTEYMAGERPIAKEQSFFDNLATVK